jgi:LysM repeat protein
MTHYRRVLPLFAVGATALFSLACLPGGGSSPRSSSTPVAVVQAVRTITPATATPKDSPTQLPLLPTLTTYIVKSGDYPTLIAENAGVPAADQEAWIAELLALNGVEATALQIGQKLILPPIGLATAPRLPTSTSGAAPPSAPIDTEPAPTRTPNPSNSINSPNIPFAATPPMIGFPSPTATATPKASPTPTPPPTAAPGARAWLTSSDETAKYYYCDLDSGWTNIPAEKLLAFDSEQELLAIWGRFRTKAPDSMC